MNASVHTLSTVKAERVTWLWPGRLPIGKLVVLDGDPSVGKSTLTIDLAARISNGAAWPDGTAGPAPADVLLLSAEDGLADTIRPRLDAARGDPDRVHALVDVEQPGPDGKLVKVPPVLPRDIPVIEKVIRDKKVRLLVVDVLMAYLSGGVDSHRDQDVRGVLHQLAHLAENTSCTILLVRHLNKAPGGNALYRGGGSIGIIGAARAGFIVARDPEDNERRILAVSKMNIAMEPPALAYRLLSDDNSGCARIEWEAGSVDLTAADLLRGPVDPEDRTERDEAADWLRDYLAEQGGTAASRDVKVAARKAGHKEHTVKRAAQALSLRITSSGFPRATYWELPEASIGTSSLGTRNVFPLTPTVPTAADLGKRQDSAVPTGAGSEASVPTDVPTALTRENAAPETAPASVGTVGTSGGDSDITECPVCAQPLIFAAVPTSRGPACRRCAPGIRAGTTCRDCGHPRDLVADGRCNPCHGRAGRGGAA